ncbi:MAG: M20/M25/M40 family metallo-hydrolase [Planctomycetota bacterium]
MDRKLKAQPQTVCMELLRELVRAESVNPPGREAAAAEVLERFLARHAIEARREEVAPGRPNVIATVGKGKPRVLLTSHLDVVPAGEEKRWKHGPFGAEIEEGVLYGRGACDAKGSIAAMAAALVEMAKAPPYEVVLAAVMGEEKGALGSKHFAERDSGFDAAIVGEPTELAVATGQKGRLGIEIEIIGEASHPTRAKIETSAIVRMGELSGFLREFGEKVEAKKQGAFVPVRVAAGEEGVLTPPERCVVGVSWWFPPSMDHEEAIKAFRSALTKAFGRKHEVRFHKGAGSYEISRTHALVATAKRAVETVTGREARTGEFGASCDMYVFGRKGIPTIALGPGSLADAHAPDECVDLEDVEAAARIYGLIVEGYRRAFHTREAKRT